MSLTGANIRQKFIDFFKFKHNHTHVPSSSLIPDNPTLLLTSAGMVQFVPIFLGQTNPPNPPRAVTVQKCARAGGKDSDIENIGQTGRHHSFFEMLGNFSFGDYFKAQIIPWAWDFITNDLGLSPDKLYVTVFAGDEINAFDEEAYNIWVDKVGISPRRIFKMSRKDNFWGPPGPTGPCGPCSEIYYDRGSNYGCKDNCGIGSCSCDRYLEIWNLVFMEFNKDENGNYSQLTKKNIDTGAGLERLATILQDKHNSFETDLFSPIMTELCKLSNLDYVSPNSPDYQESYFLTNKYLKIILDHLRCSVFLMSDGVRVSNIGRGYVLRFIIRRAARFGRLLGLTEPFLYKLVPNIAKNYGTFYEEVKNEQKLVEKLIYDEEIRFSKTIERGLTILNNWLTEGEVVLSGQIAFNLYATYGFPLELTKEIIEEQGRTIDLRGFNQAKKQHEEISSVNKFNVIITGGNVFADILRQFGKTKFNGYDEFECNAQILAIIQDGQNLLKINEGELGDLLLNQTVFYAESGGQLGDKGIITTATGELLVLDTKNHEGLNLHKVKVKHGYVEINQDVTALIDKNFRKATMLHHSSAHLFHAAIRSYLGNHVMQAGSQVGSQAMRFDFNFDRQLTNSDIFAIESMMNEWVRNNDKVTTEVLSIAEAKNTGAIAMFGEKYGDLVRVVSMGDFSKEFCGGTHIKQTGELGLIKIIQESSIASGTRRIEALAGKRAWDYVANNINILNQASTRLKIKPEDLDNQLSKLQDDLKIADKQLTKLKEELIIKQIPDLISQSKIINNISIIITEVKNIDANSLKVLAENIKAQLDSIILVLVSKTNPHNLSLIVAMSNKLTNKTFNANLLIKSLTQIANGTGGGRPDFAQAGAKDVHKINEILEHAQKAIKSYLTENILTF